MAAIKRRSIEQISSNNQLIFQKVYIFAFFLAVSRHFWLTDRYSIITHSFR